MDADDPTGPQLLDGYDDPQFKFVITNDSNIRFISEPLTARNGYLAPSVKWMFGHTHRYSLDAGVGYYLQDIAEVITDYPLYGETVLWEESAVGAFVGGTIDFRGGEPSRSHGWMMSLKVHFADFGTVRDEGRLPPTLCLGEMNALQIEPLKQLRVPVNHDAAMKLGRYPGEIGGQLGRGLAGFAQVHGGRRLPQDMADHPRLPGHVFGG